MVLQQKLFEKAYFICKLTSPVMVRPASSDFWKARQVSKVLNYCWFAFVLFSIFCITSFGICTHLRHQGTTNVVEIYLYLPLLIVDCQY